MSLSNYMTLQTENTRVTDAEEFTCLSASTTPNSDFKFKKEMILKLSIGS